jgi:hypothetical protein
VSEPVSLPCCTAGALAGKVAAAVGASSSAVRVRFPVVVLPTASEPTTGATGDELVAAAQE